MNKLMEIGEILERHKPLPLNENLRAYATEMRKNPTEEEKKIWYGYLRHLKPNFHRQRIIGNYIVDFYCPKLNLIIEIDRGQHEVLIKDNVNADINIFRSLENVNLNTLNGYEKDNEKFLFNDLYK